MAKYLRSEVVKLAQSWIGKKESDGSYKSIIDIYNGFTGSLPRGAKMRYTDPWCACTWSSIAIKLGYTAIMPIEISCGYLIETAKKMACWIEEDFYVPKPGDAILYDWDDSGIGDNTGWPDHVGIVETVSESSGYIVVIEGNYNDSVKRRTISINGKYIRGFITPNYDEEVTVSQPSNKVGKNIDTLAHEVIAGIWGSGEVRRRALTNYGYDYDTVQKRVNEILKAPTETPKVKEIISTCKARFMDAKLAGRYVTTADLNLRNDAGTNKKSLVVIPSGTEVKNYGYYNTSNGVKWFYIEAVVNGVRYVGYSSSCYLKKK